MRAVWRVGRYLFCAGCRCVKLVGLGLTLVPRLKVRRGAVGESARRKAGKRNRPGKVKTHHTERRVDTGGGDARLETRAVDQRGTSWGASMIQKRASKVLAEFRERHRANCKQTKWIFG